jgi:hypothetical protein
VTRASGAGVATSGFDAGVRVDAYCGFRDTSSVTAREIASDGELQGIAAAGVGFVITPFNRRWHAAACPHVQTMTAGTRKWFAATPAELADYLQARITQYDTAKPIDACPACVPE